MSEGRREGSDGFVIGVDIGGTFTDACAISAATGELYTAKVKTTPEDLIEGLMEALELLAREAGRSLEELLLGAQKFAHGTTQTTNVMFTWSGARTGLITTRGFGDEILIMRARGRVAGKSLSERRHLSATSKPPRIVEPEFIEEINERVDFRGRALVSLTPEEAKRAVGSLLEKGVESFAVSLLWAPENPDHELLIERLLDEMRPGAYVSLSHRLAPVVGEYERASTAAVDAYVGPTLTGYLERLSEGLAARSLRVPVLMLQAGGGVVRADHATPVNTVESGPAAGMVAVKSLAEAMGHSNVIATDVGGTTFKVGMLVEGEIPMARETIINQYSLLMPMIDLVSIGAGGGSVAWVDGSRLRVGPHSAGSQPGPACYGWGGEEPTVTDADLVLGFLNPANFLGGRLTLHPDRAERALFNGVARSLFEGDEVRAAAGVRTVVDAAMADLIRKTTIERGYDPRTFVLFSYGGAGPVHAASYARDIGVRTIVVPPTATVFSAYGAAASDIQHSVQRSVRREASSHEDELRKTLAGLEAEATSVLEEQGISRERVRFTYWADMRYERQLHDVRVRLRALPGSGLQEVLRSAFEARYQELFGIGAALRSAQPLVLRLGIEAVGAVAKPRLRPAPLETRDPAAARVDSREVFWPEVGRWVETPIFDGPMLAPGNQLEGPVIIEHPGTTVVVPHDTHASVDGYGNTVITLPGGHGG
ncbi:MAG: hydantoinase/oxoprolinase family protein [Actinomycetota bacterium]